MTSHPLCTLLPPLQPRGYEDTFTFRNANRRMVATTGIRQMHAAFSAEGLPYTLQRQPALPEADWPLEPHYGHECLTAAERNPLLR